MRKINIFLTGLLIFIIGIWLGARYLGAKVYKVRLPVSDGILGQKFSQLLQNIDQYYVDSVDLNDMTTKAIQKVLADLDPHSYYIEPEDASGEEESIQGNFDGIGIEFRVEQDTLRVLGVIPEGPAEKVGVKVGDKFLQVDTVVIAGVKKKNAEIVKLIKGPKNTQVSILLERAGKTYTFLITRNKIPIYSVVASYLLPDKNTGYIKLNRFAETSYQEFMEAVTKLKKKGMQQLIFDLRGNPGGLLQSAVAIANEFLESKELIVYIQDKYKNKSEYFATKTGSLVGMPLVVLMDEGSASASEIIAGAMQDHDRAVIVGRRSFGKGLVQNQFDWEDGSAVRLTIARYYTPSGRSIQKPYVKDQKDAYYAETSERYLHGELLYKDSMLLNDTTTYYTSKGKKVYGGGGIVPDIFVAIDTSGFTTFLSNLFYRDIFSSFVFDYLNKEENKLRQDYPDQQTFINQFALADITPFLTFAQQRGVQYSPKQLTISGSKITMYIKAYLARVLYGQEAYYEVVNREDVLLKKALESFN